MNRFVGILLLALLLTSCFLKKKKEEDFSTTTLNLFATDIFLNETFYNETMPIFENIFNCHVEITSFPTASMLLEKLSSSDSLELDVVFGLDNTLLYEALQESLFVSYESSNLDDVFEDYLLDQTNQLSPVSYSPLAFVYNSREFEKAPETFGEMQDGIFKDKIIIMSPHTSSLGRAMLIWSVAAFGENGYSHFWRSVKENIYSVADYQEEGYNMFLASQAPLVQTYSSATIYHIKQDGTGKFKASIPQEGCFKVIKTAGIARQTINMELSKHFIDFLLSNDFQEIVPELMWMFPVNKNVKLNDDYMLLPEVKNDYTTQLSAKTIGRRIDGWMKNWDKIMKK